MRALLSLGLGTLLVANASEPAAVSADAPPASESDRWAVVEVHFGDTPALGEHLHPLVQRMKSLGLPVLTPAEQTELFEREGSRDPIVVTPEAREKYVAMLTAAVGLINDGLEHQATPLLKRTHDMWQNGGAAAWDRVLEARIGRLHSCLTRLKAELGPDRMASQEQIAVCRAPSLDTPYSEDHSYEILVPLREFDARVAMQPKATLRVVTGKSHCLVRRNGSPLLLTPMNDEPPLVPLKTYDVQGECPLDGSPSPNLNLIRAGHEKRGNAPPTGRVYRVTAKHGPNVVRIFPEFDTRVRSQPRVTLRYKDAEDQARHAGEDAYILGHYLSAEQILLVTPVDDGVRLDRLDLRRASVTTVYLPNPSSSGGWDVSKLLDRGIRALASGRSMRIPNPPQTPQPVDSWGTTFRNPLDVSTGPAITIEPLPMPPPPPVDEAPRRRLAAGWALATAGVIGYGAGVAFYFQRESLADDVRQADPSNRSAVRSALTRWAGSSARRSSYTSLFLSSAVGSAGLGLLLPENDGVPIWSYAFGGAGLVAIGLGVATAARGHGCLTAIASRGAECANAEQRLDRGLLLLGSALPFLTVPLTYWIREALGRPADARVQVTSTTAALDVAVRF